MLCSTRAMSTASWGERQILPISAPCGLTWVILDGLGGGDGLQRTDLVRDVVDDVGVGCGKSAASEAEEVGVTRVSASSDASIARQSDGNPHGCGVARVVAACDVRRGDEFEETCVVPQ